MIVFQDVHKSGGEGIKIAKYSIVNVSLELPSNRRIAIFGGDGANLGMFLHLVAGSQTPDNGRVVANGAMRSPIIQASGKAGATLFPQFGTLANIKYFAGVRGLDYHRLLEIVASGTNIGERLDEPVGELDAPTRRALEVSLISALPYDYYLVDRFQSLEPDLQWRLNAVARAQKASLIFATSDVKAAVQFGEIGIACLGGAMRRFDNVRAAVEAVVRFESRAKAENSASH